MKETKRKHLLLWHNKRPQQELMDIIINCVGRIFGCVVIGGILEEGGRGGGHWGSFEQGCIGMYIVYRALALCA